MQAEENPRRRSRVGSDTLSSPFATKRPKIDSEPPPMNVKGSQTGVVDLAAARVFRPQAGTRQLVIKNLRISPNRPSQIEEHYSRALQDVEAAVDSIFLGKQPVLSYDRLYRYVEELCTHGMAKKVFVSFKSKAENHVSVVRKTIKMQGGNDTVATLRSVHEQWKIWSGKLKLLRSLLSYLDQTYLLHEKSGKQINDLAIYIYRNMVFDPKDPQAMGQKFVEGLCTMVHHDRTGDDRFDSTLFRECIMMLHILGSYEREFESPFLEQSHQYFETYGSNYNTHSLKEYILACEGLLTKENDRCMRYSLDSSTKKQLLDKAQKLLIVNYSQKLLNGGSVAKLLAENEIESMRALYYMLSLANMQDKLKEPWQDYTHKAGSSIISETKGDEMVLRLLQLKRRLELMIRDAFKGNGEFKKAMRYSFGRFMNDHRSVSSSGSGAPNVGEMVAKYMDMLLRGGLKSLPQELLSDIQDRADAEKRGMASTSDEDAELDRQLDNALELFRFIEGKAVFEGFYKKDLARRLLMGRSASQDAERSMLSKLTGECGSPFTQNLEKMFKDLELQKGLMANFKQYCEHCVMNGKRAPKIDLDAKVLSLGAWPSYPILQINLPDEVATEIERFDNFYKEKHSGRVLKWPLGLATCIVKARFPKGIKDLAVSAQQAIVLLLFNPLDIKTGFLTYKQIREATNLTDPELERTLQSLACGKPQQRVLSKHPKGRDINHEDTFKVNEQFSNSSTRIKINQIQLRETPQENKETHERIVQDRRFETQAAIVRIMKSRKTMTHPELVAEVIDMLKKRGPVDAGAVKKEIENLIEKDYLEREGTSYSYMA